MNAEQSEKSDQELSDVRALIASAKQNTQQAYSNLLHALYINSEARFLDIPHADKLLSLANDISVIERELNVSPPSPTY
jgi:hypothetical protein